ncbi:hypothetical protein ACN9MJ_13110 [Acidovorax facilis]|uniref:hypothetical protein n=1 Tax=Acidovorax facilis TaxID=12917 RepID=UPI003CEC7108
MDVQSDQYDARYRTATVQKNQGPLAALADLGLDAQQQRAGYGYLLATGQVELDRNGVPMVQPGQQLTIDLSDNRYGNTAGQAIAQESGLRAQREQQLAAQQAAETAHTAQENQESWDQMRMAWGGRTGTQGPVWHLGGSAQATATQTGGRNIDVMSMDPLGNPTGGMQQEWVSDQPGSSYAQAMGNVARSVGNFVDGATQLAVNGTITGMVVRPASSLMALPAAVFMGPEAYTAIQADLQERWSPESNNPGAIAIQQSLGQMLQPVGQALGELRTASENRFGDGWTTAGVAAAQSLLEVAGFVGGVAAIPGGRAALGSLGSSIQGGLNTLADAMPTGSGAGGLRGPGLQWGAVGDLEGLGGTTGARFGNALSSDYRGTFFEANPGLVGQVKVHHAVEQQVLNKFPGVVSEAEMHSLENLRGIPNELNNTMHLSDIRVEWNRFYKPFIAEGTMPTKAQLLQKATEIDSRFGTKFNPPLEEK